MIDIVSLLPDAVANQIAAGEVVQRPASVVKELTENAIDAGATELQVVVKDAGKLLIQVIDNGKGMSETDARMSFERHATSKIKAAEDLFSIHTKGFRGEALASIAAVAQVEMKTKLSELELGTKIKIEGSTIKEQVEEVCPDGTNICVRNLFYNVPARRNFLKSNSVEMRHITEEFQRLALAHPDVKMELHHNDLLMFSCPKAKLSQRIVDIFGKSYKQQLAKIEEDTPNLKIEGFIGKPEFAKKSKGEQYFFVNNRFIKSPYLNHAVNNAFEGLIAKDSYPFYVIFLEVDPRSIDINVHPTKTEIKFEDERLIYGILHSAVRKSLGVHNFGQSLDFEADTNLINRPEFNRSTGQTTGSGFKNPSDSEFRSKPQEDWQKLYEGLEQTAEQPEQANHSLTFSSGMNDSNSDQEDFERSGNVLQILNRYIVTQVKSGMLLIDQHLAHQRVLYEKYLGMLKNKFGASQQFLFPQTIELSPTDHSIVIELEADIRSLGFVFNDFGQNTIVLNGIPADAPSGQEKELFEGLIQSYKENKGVLKLSTHENLARALSKRSAIRPGTKMNDEEMKKIIDELFACSTPEYAPTGERAMTILKEEELKQFLS